MNLNTLLNRDLTRLARSSDAPKLIGRPSTDPRVLEENEFVRKHGMSSANYDEMRRAHQQHNFETQAVCDLNGAPPDLCNTRGLGPKRAALANFFEWQHGEAKRLDNLRARKAELETVLGSPAKTELEISDAVRKTAAAMVGGTNAGEGIDRAALDAQLSRERHQSEAAQIALIEIGRHIETAELRVDHLNSRESEFVNPALIEAADEIGLGKAYVRKIAELREICNLMNGLAHVAGEFGSGFGQPSTINFTKMGLPSLAATPNAEYTILSAGNDSVWEAMARAIKMNPRMDASKFVAVPK